MGIMTLHLRWRLKNESISEGQVSNIILQRHQSLNATQFLLVTCTAVAFLFSVLVSLDLMIK
jgi:hypothetical protein